MHGALIYVSLGEVLMLRMDWLECEKFCKKILMRGNEAYVANASYLSSCFQKFVVVYLMWVALYVYKRV